MYPIDGLALLVESKKRSPSTQVIMMTGFLRRKQQMGEKKYGAANYFANRWISKKLKTVLRDLLADRH